MEAMSFGIPVIATKVGGVSEIVIDNFNGYLLNVNTNSNEISSKISSFLTYQIKTSISLLKCFDTWNSHYNAEKL